MARVRVCGRLRHAVARVAVMLEVSETSPGVLPPVPSQDMRPGEPGGMQLLGPRRLTLQVVAAP